MKCSTIGCREPAGRMAVTWEDLEDEPVCDECAARYKRMEANSDFLVLEVSQ